jgi:hypothetical protein
MPPKRKPAPASETRVETAMLEILANPERVGTPQDVAALSDTESLASSRSARSARSVRSVRSARSARSERSAAPSAAPSVRSAPEPPAESRQRAAYVKLMRFAAMGQQPTRPFAPTDDAEALEGEVLMQEAMLRERLEEQRGKDGVRFARRMLLAFTSFSEFMNRRYDPFGVDIDGWSDSVMQNITDYDRPFERLIKKYQGRAEMAPEVELLVTLGSSMFMFHLSRSFAARMSAESAPTAAEAKASVVQVLTESDDEDA